MRWPTKAPVSPRTDTNEHNCSWWCFPTARRLCRAVAVGCDRVLGCATVLLPPLFPKLAEVTQKQPASPLPASAPAMVANEQMKKAFPDLGSEDNVLLVLLTNDKGLGPADEQVTELWSTACTGTVKTS